MVITAVHNGGSAKVLQLEWYYSGLKIVCLQTSEVQIKVLSKPMLLAEPVLRQHRL